MQAALNGLASTVKHSATKDSVSQAKETLKRFDEKKDVPPAYVREKCLAAVELAFDHGTNEKHTQYAVDAVQALLRDNSYRDEGSENSQQHLACQLLVEMMCSNEMKIELVHVEECLQLYKRLYGGSDEESVRVACRAATSQSISSYFYNRYAVSDGAQEQIAVYLDATKLLEEVITNLEQVSTGHEQCIILLDAVHALLSAHTLAILSHQPFVNILWEKLCPLMILLIGVPQKGNTTKIELQNEPVGQGQIDFSLSPSVCANPDATRALYQIVEQLFHYMAAVPSLFPSLQALFHKAFLFPKIEQRAEALKLIKKITSDREKLRDIATCCVISRSQSLWHMMIASISECANPKYEISIEAVRCCVGMLQGLVNFSEAPLFSDATRQAAKTAFPTKQETLVESFTLRQNSSLGQPESPEADLGNLSTEEDKEIVDTLKRLEFKFNCGAVRPSYIRQSSEFDESSEKSTAQKFAESLTEVVEEWATLKSSLAVDEAILQFSSDFYSKFCAVHAEAFKNKSKVQQEFLNTDAIYLTSYACLSLACSPPKSQTADRLKHMVLTSGCVIHISESWLDKVFEFMHISKFASSLTPLLRDIVNDFDGEEKKVLSDVYKLRKIQLRDDDEIEEEVAVGRWLMCGAWKLIVNVLTTFLLTKTNKAREKIRQAVEHSINGTRLFALAAQRFGLMDRCSWMLETLVEWACCVEELRTAAATDEKWSCASREQLLAMQLVLDHAHIAISSPHCWKHLIRCTEHVWELEKYIYGALCYEKPSRLRFLRKEEEPQCENEDQGDAIDAADNTVEKALGDTSTLTLHSINRAICVLIAKVDRFYAKLPRELCLPALQDLCTCLVSASENRVLYSDHKQASLAPPVNLLSRLSEVISTLSRRPLVHQMYVWPVVSAHLVQVCERESESRLAAAALADSAASMLLQEPAGLCFNQSLIIPFQTATCSERCLEETKEQLISSLSTFVRSHAERIGSGWKPLFGSLRAVRISRTSTVQWSVIDAISAYLHINRPQVLSASLLDCIGSVVHFLQFHGDETEDEKNADAELSQAALRLLPALYSVISNLYTTSHNPNYHLLHRCDLRARCLDQVDVVLPSDDIPTLSSCLPDTDAYDPDIDLEVKHGPLPWEGKQPYEVAALELLFSFLEYVCGTLLTSETSVQTALLELIQQVIVDMANTQFGADCNGFCMCNIVLPYMQKWLRRVKEEDVKTLKQAVGKCSQMAIDLLSDPKLKSWSDRILRDVCEIGVECCGLNNNISAVGAGCLRHIAENSSQFSPMHWLIFGNAIWRAASLTLYPIRFVSSFFIADSEDESGDIGSVFVTNRALLPLNEMVLAHQVFSAESRPLTDAVNTDEEIGEPGLMCKNDNVSKTISVRSLLYSMQTHGILLKIVGQLLVDDDDELKASLFGVYRSVACSLSNEAFATFYRFLDATYHVASQVDRRPALGALISRTTRVENANLLKILVTASFIKSLSLLRRYRMEKYWKILMKKDQPKYRDPGLLARLAHSTTSLCGELKQVEMKICAQRSAIYSREHAESKFHFMLVVQDEQNMYQIVSQKDVEKTFSEYEQHRERLKVDRKNPFSNDTSHEAVVNEAPSDEKFDLNAVRLVARRDVCLVPLRRLLSSGEADAQMTAAQVITSLLISSPDLGVRKLAVDIIDLLVKKESFE